MFSFPRIPGEQNHRGVWKAGGQMFFPSKPTNLVKYRWQISEHIDIYSKCNSPGVQRPLTKCVFTKDFFWEGFWIIQEWGLWLPAKLCIHHYNAHTLYYPWWKKSHTGLRYTSTIHYTTPPVTFSNKVHIQISTGTEFLPPVVHSSTISLANIVREELALATSAGPIWSPPNFNPKSNVGSCKEAGSQKKGNSSSRGQI